MSTRHDSALWFDTASAVGVGQIQRRLADLGGAGLGVFCRAINETLKFTPAALTDVDVPFDASDPDAVAAPYGADTSVVATYLPRSGDSCSNPSLVSDTELRVVSYAKKSTVAKSWRDAYEKDASERVVDPAAVDFGRDGVRAFDLAVGPTTAQVVAVDERKTAALFDIGDTMVVLTGSFPVGALEAIAKLLEPQS